MSEVEKMYENAGVNPVCDGLDCFTCAAKCNNGKYPEFTAEKQLELIKWLAKFNVRIEYTEYTNAKYFIESHYHGYSVYIACFEEALAGFINTLWQDLTEEEQEQIKRIFE